jgi:hypothetical protein
MPKTAQLILCRKLVQNNLCGSKMVMDAEIRLTCMRLPRTQYVQKSKMRPLKSNLYFHHLIVMSKPELSSSQSFHFRTPANRVHANKFSVAPYQILKHRAQMKRLLSSWQWCCEALNLVVDDMTATGIRRESSWCPTGCIRVEVMFGVMLRSWRSFAFRKVLTRWFRWHLKK